MNTKTKVISIFVFLLAVIFTSSALKAANILQFIKVNTHPSNRELSNENSYSEEAQGIAFDGSHWFYSNKYHIYRFNRDFKNSDRKYHVSTLRFGTEKCGHVGGIDYYKGNIYVGLDNCSDNLARVVIFDRNLNFKKYAIVPQLKELAWIAVNPHDDTYLYTIAPNGKQLLAFPRHFSNAASINSVKVISFIDHPQDKLGHIHKQGGAFTASGLFFRTVDDSENEYSSYTGIWVYELEYPILNGSTARCVGLINIKYNPDQWGSYRQYELEDLDVSTVTVGPTTGDIHIIMLSNEGGDEDDVSVYHYTAGDYDGDGIKDVHDNCIWVANVGQEDLDLDGRGTLCDNDEVGSVLLPAIILPLQ